MPLNSLFDPSLRKSTANRLDYLYEISHVPKDSKIPINDFPIVNPYTIFNKPQSSLKIIYIYIYWPFSTFYYKRICPSLKVWPVQYSSKWWWKLHYSFPPQGICQPMAKARVHSSLLWCYKVALTSHGRKRLPTVSKMALLNSRFLEYQHAVIGTI